MPRGSRRAPRPAPFMHATRPLATTQAGWLPRSGLRAGLDGLDTIDASARGDAGLVNICTSRWYAFPTEPFAREVGKPSTDDSSRPSRPLFLG